METVTELIPLMDNLSEFVKFRRGQLGLTQQEVADKIDSKGIDANYISRIEHKRIRGVHMNTLQELMSALDSNITFNHN